MSKETSRKSSILPSWLWFWLISYLLFFPIQIHNWDFYFKDFNSLSIEMSNLENVPELMPSLALFFGVIVIFFPLFRAKKLEKDFELDSFYSALPTFKSQREVALEIENFLRLHASTLQIKANFNLFNQDPFVYASRYRKDSIALFADILGLWKSNQKVAEAVLLHEIGHHRNGDASIIGAGSFFEWVLRNSFTITALFFLVPFTLLIVSQEMTFIYTSIQGELTFLDTLRIIGKSSSELILDFLSFFSSIIVHELGKVIFVYIPGILFIIIGLLLWEINIFILPIVGIWCSELNADRFMMESSDSKDAPIRALDRISVRMPFSRWLLSQVAHPPKWFRKWMLRDTKYTESNILFYLIFPLACFIKLGVLLIWAFLNYLTAYIGDISKFSTVLNKLAIDTNIYLHSFSQVWLFSSIFILLWPIIAVYWVKFFSGEVERFNWENYKQHIVSAGMVLCLFAISSFI